MRKLHEHKIKSVMRQGYICLPYSNHMESFIAIGRGCMLENKATKEKILCCL